jgi:hypothetical protein
MAAGCANSSVLLARVLLGYRRADGKMMGPYLNFAHGVTVDSNGELLDSSGNRILYFRPHFEAMGAGSWIGDSATGTPAFWDLADNRIPDSTAAAALLKLMSERLRPPPDWSRRSVGLLDDARPVLWSAGPDGKYGTDDDVTNRDPEPPVPE